MEIQNKVVAHRGAWKRQHLPQNSMLSLKEAFRLQCGASEFDVRMTNDKTPIIVHDEVVNCQAVERVSYEEILKNKTVLPTLREYIMEGVKQHYTKLVLEIKSSLISKEHDLELTRKCVDTVKDLEAEHWVEYIAFDYELLKYVLTLDSSARVYYLGGNVAPKQLKQDGFYGFDYNYNVLKQKPQWIKEAKDLCLLTHSWTVNDAESMNWLLDQGIDFISTDTPEELFELIELRRQC
jgi:glycerophosphoryl diester phosphodiesterase